MWQINIILTDFFIYFNWGKDGLDINMFADSENEMH